MKKTEKERQKFLIFKKAALPVSAEKKAAALENIREAADGHNLRPRLSVWELIRIQLAYISPGYWIGQGMVFAALAIYFHNMEVTDSFRDCISWFSAAVAFMGVFGVAELGKHFSNKAAEVEQSCYFRLEQLWMMKMILFGGVDILGISAFTGGIAERTGVGAGAVCVYLLAPFLLSNACYMLLLTACRGGGGRYQQFGAALLLGIAAMLPSVNPRAYYANYLWVWLVALAAGAALLIGETRALYDKMAKGETLCWN